MIHPYIDCARRLAAKGVRAGDIESIECDVAQGTVHRLWEPLATKQAPPNAYAAKFSQPWCIAYGLVRGPVGLGAFTDELARDPQLVALARKVSYRIDPDNPYPDEYTGHVRVKLRDGRQVEERQAHLRGGHHEPLADEELQEKFRANCAVGGWDGARAEAWLAWTRRAFTGAAPDLAPFRG
jgi:2-methylcitrate dehydratase PrpD